MTADTTSNQNQHTVGAAGSPAWYTSEQILDAVSVDRARKLLESTLASGFRPQDDPARSNIPAGTGHLLLMPSVLDPDRSGAHGGQCAHHAAHPRDLRGGG